MSLSFVKSAVLSSTDGVSHNEETTIDNNETQSLRASGGGGHKPLFEQLRANKDAEQEKDDEFQRSIRGTRPLDEEDCAHLDSVERRRTEQEYSVKSGIEREVALFRAAREDRGLARTVLEGGDAATEEDVKDNATTKTEAEPIVAAKKEAKKIVPKFTIKKKRKRLAKESDSNHDIETKKIANDVCKTKVDKEIGVDDAKSSEKHELSSKPSNESDNEGGGLLGLGCYGSDSD